MPKSTKEVPLRCLGTALSLLLLIVNILGAVVLFVFGPFFLLRAYENIYFGTFSIIVVLSLIVSMISFAWPEGHNLIYTVANRYWVLIVFIAARGVGLAYDIWAAQDTLVGQCQAARKIEQSSSAFVTDLLVDSSVTCSDGVRIFSIITLTALSVDLFLHIAISICSRGIRNIHWEKELPLEMNRDRAIVDTERRNGLYAKHVLSDERNGTGRTFGGGRIPGFPQRPLNGTYAPSSLPINPYLNASNRSVYTIPAQTNQAPYQTIQLADRPSSTASQSGGNIGGFTEQGINWAEPLYPGREKMVPISTCQGTDGNRREEDRNKAPGRFQLRDLPSLYPQKQSMEPIERHQQAVVNNSYRIDSFNQSAFYSDGETPNSPDLLSPIMPEHDAPFVLPGQARFVESPTSMVSPFLPASTDVSAENSIFHNGKKSVVDPLLKDSNQGVQLLVANPDVTPKDICAKSVNDNGTTSKTSERLNHIPTRTTREQSDTGASGHDSPRSTRFSTELGEGFSLRNLKDLFAEKRQSALNKKLVEDDYTGQPSIDRPYRNELNSNNRLSDPSYFRRRPYPYSKKRPGSYDIETKHSSNGRAICDTGDQGPILQGLGLGTSQE